MQKNHILIALFSLLGLKSLMAQSPASFNYQAVPRKQDSLLYNAGQTLGFRFQVREGSSSGNVVFAETNSLTVNRQGAVNTAIGSGFAVNGVPHNLQAVNWGSNNYYLSVDMDVNNNGSFESNENFGTSQLLSVPFAMYAAKSGSGGGGGSDNQTLSVSGTQLSISNGNTVDLPLDIYQAGDGVYIFGQTINAFDESPDNELQNLSINGNQLSISNGNMVQLPESNYQAGDGVYIFGQTISAYDESPNNELQSLSISGNQLTISQGNTITLPTGGGGGGLTLPYAGTGNSGNDLFKVTNNGFGAAIHGVNTIGGTAILGEDLAGGLAGVQGYSTSSYGVLGTSDSGVGVLGQVNTGTAIRAEATNGTAIVAIGTPAMDVTGTARFNNGVFVGSVEHIRDGGPYVFEFTGRLQSNFDNIDDLGSSSRRWKSVYAANGTINTSDARLKRDIRPLGYGIDEVMQLQPVSYQWVDGQSGEGRYMGFLAQDLQQVIPEVVRDKEWVYDAEDRSTGHWQPAAKLGVAYSEIIPVAVAAIQEQQKQIDALRAELEASKKQNQAQIELFRADLQAVKKQMGGQNK